MKSFKGLNYRRPAYLLILMNLLGFGLLFLANDQNLNIIYIGAGLLTLFMLIYTIIVLCRMGDKFIVLMACMLITIGVLLLCRINIDYPGARDQEFALSGDFLRYKRELMNYFR